MSVAQAYAILEHSSVVELPAYIRRVPGSIPGVPIFQNGGMAMISEFVEYVKQVWKNKPNVSSPLNADRLNHMEDGIENNSKKIKETVTAVNELTENRGHAYGEKFTSGNTDIDITKWAVTSLLCIATYNETAMYVIRKETSSKIFCLPIKSSTQLTVSKNGENSISLANSMTEGGNWTVFY